MPFTPPFAFCSLDGELDPVVGRLTEGGLGAGHRGDVADQDRTVAAAPPAAADPPEGAGATAAGGSFFWQPASATTRATNETATGYERIRTSATFREVSVFCNTGACPDVNIWRTSAYVEPAFTRRYGAHGMARPKILIVDDNQELTRLLARLIDAEGWESLPFLRGKPAIQAIPKEQPAFAIVDILLPDMLGYEVGAALRQAGVPFVFTTGIFKGPRGATEARMVHGAVGYFDKPFEAKKLLDSIRGHVPPEPSVPVGTPPPIAKHSRVQVQKDFDMAVSVEPEEPVAAVESHRSGRGQGDGRDLRGDHGASAPGGCGHTTRQEQGQ